MPRISEFYGILIFMYGAAGAPAHFHAVYRIDQATVAIDDGAVLDGSLPPRALRLVEEWRRQHLPALRDNWALAARGAPLARVPPLH